MSKVLTDKELGQIIYDATHDPGVIDCADSYRHFLEDLGALICDHFGGELGNVDPSVEENLDWFVSFKINECVPANGGVFAQYDTDVIWEDGVEIEIDEDESVVFHTLGADGSLSETRSIKKSDIEKCPFLILVPSHYREDGSCKCNDPQEQEMMIREWGYKKKDFDNIK